jgi:hypothetical protein
MVRLDCLLVIWLSASIFERFFFSRPLSVILKPPCLLTFREKFSYVFLTFSWKVVFYCYAFIRTSSVPSRPIMLKWHLFLTHNSVPQSCCKLLGQSWFSSTMSLDLLSRTLTLPADWEHWSLAEVIQFLVIGNHGWLVESDAQIHICCDCL